MNVSPLVVARVLLPQLPLLLKILVLNRLGISTCAEKQDTRTEIVVAIIKSFLTGSKPLSQIQASGFKDPGIKGQVWIATARCPAPIEDGAAVREAVILAIRELASSSNLEDLRFDLPEITDVEGEWTGHRSGVDKNAPRPQLPGGERDHYKHLMKEVTSPTTILYFHGGAYFMMDPSSHRAVTGALAKKTGGRCFSVRYRLAPQTPFPGQLVDALTAYLYLLAPPRDGTAFHEPIKPNNIVFAGDSAGGHLSFGLLLLILTLRRAGVSTIRFHGVDVPLELPAGVAGNSPWLDICRSLPSIRHNAKYDYLDPPSPTGLPLRPLPEDDIWPTKPPRADIFCRASTILHPLCSPLSATSDMWAGAPPVWMCTGNEGLEDEITVLARRIYAAGGPVEFVGYEGQPHCFGMIFPSTKHGADCITRWADFATRAANGNVQRTDEATWWKAKTDPMEWTSVKLAEMGVADDVVRQRMGEMQQHAVEREEVALREYEKTGRAKL